MSKAKLYINADLNRYAGNNSLKSFVYCFLRIQGFRFLYFYRRSQWGKNYNPLTWLSKLMYVIMSFKYGFQIPLSAEIAPGFYIGHYGTIVINRFAKIGSNCNITHNVTIGQANRGKYKGAPEIGNKVWIGTGAVIVGKIVIGDNVLIAPNAYVNFDIPSNSLVLGNPAVIKQKDASIVNGYIENVSP